MANNLIFKDALYYPFIEIHNHEWIKTACLFWDSISTIVPVDLNLDLNDTTKYLLDEGILKQTIVDPELPEVIAAAKDSILYDEKNNGILSIATEKYEIHSGKLPNFNEAYITQMLFEGATPSGDLRNKLSSLKGKGWENVPLHFGKYYMTLLASNLAYSNGLTLVTDYPSLKNISVENTISPYSQQVPAELSTGLMADISFKTVNINSFTPLKKILKFRNNNIDALSQYRSAIRDIVGSISGDEEIDRLEKHLQTKFVEELLPAFEEIKRKLHEHRISLGISSLKISALSSLSPTILALVLSNAGYGQMTLYSGLAATAYLYACEYIQKRDSLLKNSPFSYVLNAEKEFGTRKDIFIQQKNFRLSSNKKRKLSEKKDELYNKNIHQMV